MLRQISTTDYIKLCKAIKKSSDFRTVDIYYFHTIAEQVLETIRDTVQRNPRRVKDFPNMSATENIEIMLTLLKFIIRNIIREI